MNPVAFSLGPITIYWYSLFILTGLIIGSIIGFIEAKKHQISFDFMIDLLFYMVPLAIICARIYFVAFHWDYYHFNPIEILYIWEGGLAIHGAILGGLAFLLYFTRKHDVNPLLLTDIIVISLILGQAIGRWGNFLNSEAFGPATTLSHLQSLQIPQFVIDGMYIDGIYHIPTFFYESIACFFGFFMLLLFRQRKQLKLGQLTSIYLIWYGVIRFFNEGLRTDSLMLGSLKIAQFVSIIMIGIGIILWINAVKTKRLYHKEVANEI
ncbi:MAG: prolipoprotein diacylglyceryl transferase [Bacilli bacterium]|jgi:phosphatidylglycerol:prolipoprotein diacylglycerol transferase|nr:prolipoprotein diacylglyceryl transferase [Bacilli bacterium]